VPGDSVGHGLFSVKHLVIPLFPAVAWRHGAARGEGRYVDERKGQLYFRSA
jgi:hypothetical protein